MGQSGSAVYKQQKEKNKGGLQNKQDISPVQPYVEGMKQKVKAENKIQKLLPKTFQDQYQEDEGALELQNFKDKILNGQQISQELQKIEQEYYNKNKKVDEEQIQLLQESFEEFSKDNKMSRKKFLEYFGMSVLEKTELGDRFFYVAQSQLSNNVSGPYLDFSKFLKMIGVLKCGSQNDILILIYQIFDLNLDGNVDKTEFRQTIQMFLEAMHLLDFHDNIELHLLRNQILEVRESLIDQILDKIVDDIFRNLQNQKMNFSDWKRWFLDNPNNQHLIQYLRSSLN